MTRSHNVRNILFCSLFFGGVFFVFFGIVFNQNPWPPTLWATMLFYTEFIKLKNHTHVKWGTPQDFLLAFIDELWKTQKIRILKKRKKKKSLEIYIILHMCTKNHNHTRYSSWDMEWDRLFGHFGPFFCTLTPHPPNNPENQNFEKLKKASGDVIILNLRNKKHNHMIYSYSEMKCDAHNFFCHFRPFSALLPHYWPGKLKFAKKTPGDIILLHMCTINQDHKMYDSWGIKCKRQSFLSFWAIFCPLTLTTQKSKFWKNKKSTWRYYHFTLVYHK